MRFKPGQEVTPVKKASEWVNLTGTPMPFPDFGQIYTVWGYPNPQYPEMVKLEEIEGNFLYFEGNFEPLVPVEKLEKDLSEVLSIDESIKQLLHG